MSFPTASPRLQTEFLHFLEQRLSSIESQLNASEKERDGLRSTLMQTKKRLEASNKEMEELRRSAADMRDHDNALKQVSAASFASERTRREETERLLSEARAKLETVSGELAQSNADLQRRLVDSAHLQDKLAKAENARVVALAARDAATVTEKRLRQQLTKTTASLNYANKKNNLSVKAKTSDEHRDDVGTHKFKQFKAKLSELPEPAERIDYPSLVPMQATRKILENWLAELRREGVLKQELDLIGGEDLMWFPNSHHAMQVVQMHEYDPIDCICNWSERCPEKGSSERPYEVFRAEENQISYVGTYRVVEDLREIRLGDIMWKMFPGKTESAVAATLAQQTACDAPQTNAVAETLPELYSKGIMQVEVIGYQCVGFNRRLDEELHKKAPPPAETSPECKSDMSNQTMSDDLSPDSRRRREIRARWAMHAADSEEISSDDELGVGGPLPRKRVKISIDTDS
ncbi:uncharacterized protein C8Q71DRAFT_773718, partial [Rhodofomes roseus]